MLAALSVAGVVSSMPTRQTLPVCCASAPRGHASAVPPRNVMSSRRLIVVAPKSRHVMVATGFGARKGYGTFIMAALGQKPTYALQQATSALHPIASAKADMKFPNRKFCRSVLRPLHYSILGVAGGRTWCPATHN